MSNGAPVNIKDHIDKWVLEVTKGVVQTGPFIGMQVLPEIIWQANSLGPMLLGCFEEELHPALEQEIERLAPMFNPKVVNVGCSEGYYAIGLARRLPQATVWAVDINDDALRVACEAAAVNGVHLVVGDNLDSIFAAPDLIVMDCEGAEVEYLAPDRFPALQAATIIVEIHDWPGGPKLGEVIANRFKGTHTIEHIIEGARNPNKYPCLTTQTSMIRWAAVCEYRPCLMGWFVMRPK